jgi:hypothetical protein
MAAPPSVPPASTAHVNELTLAGIRPGRDSLATAEKRLKQFLKESGDGSHEWVDFCHGLAVKIESDGSGMIQSVDIGRGPQEGACKENPDSKIWATGHGLHLNDKLERAIEIYGEPSSQSPSVKNGLELELLYYEFDWAGSDVPQVMEVSCEKTTGRVVEIMLAFPSL